MSYSLQNYAWRYERRIIAKAGMLTAPLAALSRAAAVFLIYYVTGRLGLAGPFTSGNVAAVWLPAGVAMAALLMFGYRVWPAIAAGALAVNYFSPIPAAAALLISVGNTVGPLAAVWVLRSNARFTTALHRVGDVVLLVLVATPLSAAISAIVGVSALYVTHVDPWPSFHLAWLVWWLGDMTGVLLVTPLVLTLSERKWIMRRGDAVEVAAITIATAFVSITIFDGQAIFGIDKDVFSFAALPLILWAATRFEIPGAAAVTMLMVGIAMFQTANGLGPFVRYPAMQNVAALQAFIAVLSVSGLILAAAMVQRVALIRRDARHDANEQSQRSYREIIETANDGIWMLDAQLHTIFVNPRMASMLGHTVSEMTGKPLSDFVPTQAWADKQASLRHAEAPRYDHGQTQYRRKDGSLLDAEISRTRAFDDEGALTGVLKMVSDISGQKRVENEREEALARVELLSQAVEETTDTVIVSDSTGRIEYANPAFEGLTGYTSAEALGKSQRLLEPQHDIEAPMWRQLLAGVPYRGTLLHRKKAGTSYWVNQTITPIKDGQGRITSLVTVMKDVTEARKYHEQDVKLRLARRVQERFNPVAPSLPGLDLGGSSCPADETGGDYYDFIEGPDGSTYIAIGDVSGHGFDAALIMALTRAYIRSLATLGMDVGEVLRRVNSSLMADLEENRYVTMLLVRLDTSRALTYASAGHIPGVIVDTSGAVIDCIDSTGVPLGLFPGVTFATRRIALSPGHIVVLGTDGATEILDDRKVEFGRDGVVRYVCGHVTDSAQAIAKGVCDAARSFGWRDGQADDITSVIVKVLAAPASVFVA